MFVNENEQGNEREPAPAPAPVSQWTSGQAGAIKLLVQTYTAQLNCCWSVYWAPRTAQRRSLPAFNFSSVKLQN